MGIDRNGLELLERADCLRLLAAGGVGRLGLTAGALPVILPITFALDDDCVVFRTLSAVTLQHAARGSIVAFEADDYDAAGHAGWSVLVTGKAELVRDTADAERLEGLGLPVWSEEDHHFVRVSTDMVSGRRTVRACRPALKLA